MQSTAIIRKFLVIFAVHCIIYSATLLSGRYIEIRLLPLSFAEYCYQSPLSAEENYRRYLSLTSFPYGLQLPHAEAVREYLNGLYSTVVLKDIVSRRKLQDMDLLERVVCFLSDNIGSLTSVKSITNNLQAGGRKVSDHTVESYMQSLVECFLFYRIERYDIRGKQRLKVGHKYYIADLGIRHLLIGIRGNDLGHLLKNIVCLELLRRGYQVMIGKMGDAEVISLPCSQDSPPTFRYPSPYATRQHFSESWHRCVKSTTTIPNTSSPLTRTHWYYMMASASSMPSTGCWRNRQRPFQLTQNSSYILTISSAFLSHESSS